MIEVKTLDSICLKITDGAHHSPKEFQDGIPMFSVKDMTDHGFDKSSVKTISKEDYKKLKSSGCEPEDSDVLIAKDGSVMKHVFRYKRHEDCAILSSIAILRPNMKIIDPDYLVYSIINPRVKGNIISNYVSGSGVPRIVLKDFKKIEIEVPEIRIQKKVSKVLNQINSKIELNQKINENLEEIAKTLFKSWFIDFDPVRAKAEGRPTGISKEFSDLFPDSFEDSELGEIPRGWKVRSLGDFYAVNKGLSYKGKFLTEYGMPMINLGCFGGNGIFLKGKIKPYSGEFKERHIISKGEIAIANTDMTQNRITLGSPIIVDEINGNSDFLFTHHVFCLKNISDQENLKYFTYHTLLNPKFRGIAGNYATGTTVLALPKDAIENFQVILPSKQILNAFNEMVDLNFKKSKINYEESIILGDLRDKLLPKLISGELQISDAEDLIEEAGV